jgi:hypothetical protein
MLTPDAAARVLGIGLGADLPEIERAFRSRSRSAHPDRFPNSTAAQSAAAATEFIRITEARDVLRSFVAAGRPPQRQSSQQSQQQSSPQFGQRAQSRQSPQPPRPPRRSGTPMTFEQFEEYQESQSWLPFEGTEPAAPPESAPKKPWLRRSNLIKVAGAAVLAILVVLALIAMVRGMPTGFIQGQLAGAGPSGSTDITSSVRVEFNATPTSGAAPAGAASAGAAPAGEGSRGQCPDDAGCWVITLTSATTCAAATVSVGFSATPEGPIDGMVLQHLTLGTAISERLLVPASAAPSGDSYARVVSVNC